MFVSAPTASFLVAFGNKKITYFNHETLRLQRDKRIAPLAGVHIIDCKSVVGSDQYQPVRHAITFLFLTLMFL